MTVTVFDLGSNSFQMLQARVTDAGRVEPLFSAIEFVQLARFVSPQGVLVPEGFDEGVAAVSRLISRAPPSAKAGPVVAIATCAVRDSSNGVQFLEAVRAETGLAVSVLTGEQEAALTYIGATSEVGRSGLPMAVVDLGGGATQLAWGIGARPEHMVSVRLGVLALAERLAGLSNVGNVAIEQMAAFVRRTIEPAIVGSPSKPPQILVFASGVARLILSLVYSYGLVAKGNTVPSVVLADLIPRLLEATPEELQERGVPAKRLQSIGPTAVVLGVITDLFGLDRFVVPHAGLREGVALHAASFTPRAWPTPPSPPSGR